MQEAITAHALNAIRVLEREQAVRLLERELEEQRSRLRGHLLTLYGFGRQGYLRLLLALDPQHDLPSAIRQVRFLARRDTVAVQEIERLGDSLAEERDVLLEERARSSAWLERERLRRGELDTTRARQRALLEKAEKRRRELVAEAEDLRQREERLGRLIGLLLEGEEALSGVAVQEFRGVLDWPTEGRIVEEFGLRQDPRYKTLVPFNGVGILPRHTPAEVRPVYRGKVLYAAPFQGFGLTVVVSHSGGILSLYAGLDDLRVGKGDVVSLRSLLGTTTARLYFEIRDGNRPVNPRGWLR